MDEAGTHIGLSIQARRRDESELGENGIKEGGMPIFVFL